MPSGKAAPSDPWLGKPEPGLIAGAADDAPSGIATYSQAGAQSGVQSGLGMLWTVCLAYPLMQGIRAIGAKEGRLSGHGLAMFATMVL